MKGFSMKYPVLLAVSLIAAAGCTITDHSESHTAPPYDPMAVCLTEQGQPASEGTTYNGKTCRPRNDIDAFTPSRLVWR
jgi:hypothetical protein